MAGTQIWDSLPPVLVAQAAAAASKPIFGFASIPEVVNHGDYCEIILTPQQQDQVAEFMIRQLDAAPGAVRVDLSAVMTKVIAKKYGVYVAAGLGGAALFGALFGRPRGRVAKGKRK